MKKHIWGRKVISLGIGCLLFPLIFSSCIATQQDIMVLNRQMMNLSSQVYKLEGVREKQADVGAELDRIREELRRLSGELEENRHLVKHTVERDTLDQDALNARLASLEKKVSQIAKHLDLEPLAEPQGQVPEMAPEETSPGIKEPQLSDELSADPAKILYEGNLAAFREGRYDEAVLGFKNLVKTYPQSNLADNAQFWIGEAYMALKKYEQAIQAYNEVITKYPTGNKVPNAMLKQALAFIEVKDDVAAKIVLKNLIKKYPNSDESQLAEAKLKTIK